jgi:hypothetical protein
MAGTRKLYVVQRIEFGWQGDGRDPWHGGEVERAFRTRKAAEAFRAERDRAVRLAGDPGPLCQAAYHVDSLLRWTEFDPPVFQDWLNDADIPPPPPDPWENVDPQAGEDGWQGWVRRLTPGQVAHLYEGLHRLSFYRVLELDCVDGEYPPEMWEDWERNLDQAPGPADEEEADFPRPGYPGGPAPTPPWVAPPGPGGAEDDIPF